MITHCDYLVVGIDPGIRNSFGFVVVNIIFGLHTIKEFTNNTKKLLSGSMTAQKKKAIFEKAFKERSFETVLITGEVFEFKNYRNSVLKDMLAKIKKSEKITGNKVKIIAIEDFLFFNLRDKRRYDIQTASWFTVARIQNVIGYVCGFFEAKGYKATVVKPRTWKSIVEPHHVVITNRLFSHRLPKREKEHITSAVGIAVSFVPELIKETYLNFLEK